MGNSLAARKAADQHQAEKGPNDNFDQGGKSFQARILSGFDVGPYGLYLNGDTTGEINYDIRLAESLLITDDSERWAHGARIPRTETLETQYRMEQ